MPDLAMCGNSTCSVRHKCYRYLAEPNPQHQVWANFPGGEDCTGFVHAYRTRRMRSFVEADAANSKPKRKRKAGK